MAVVGAGCFGAWTALRVRERGLRVVLLDQYGPGNARSSSGGESRIIRMGYGPGNARSSSGGESRIIRMGYGPDELYARFAFASLAAWKRVFEATGEPLFHATGVLWLARTGDRYALDTLATLGRLGLPHERLSAEDLRRRYPQFALDEDMWGMIEPASGALMARRAVQAVVREAIQAGVEYRTAAVASPPAIRASVELRAGTVVFACGAWLPKLFPDLLGARIFPTRQEVFFFGAPPGDERFALPRMPTWIDFGAEIYGLPDLEGRGFKVAPDRHGEPIDPDTEDRVVAAESVARVRAFLGRRFPALATAPLLETRVCQYENTSNGDFLIDRHPDANNVWLVGGGSGHGFKHGPAVGEYVAERLAGGGPDEPRFSLASKATVERRTIF